MTTNTMTYSISYEKELSLSKKDVWSLVKTLYKAFLDTIKLEDVLGLI